VELIKRQQQQQPGKDWRGRSRSTPLNGFPFRYSRKFKVDTVESYRMSHEHLRVFAIFFSEIKLNTRKRLESEGVVFYLYFICFYLYVICFHQRVSLG